MPRRMRGTRPHAPRPRHHRVACPNQVLLVDRQGLREPLDRHRRLDQSRHDHVRPNTELRVRKRKRLVVGVDPGLRSLVRDRGHRADGTDRRDRDDGATSLLPHHGEHPFARNDDALQVDGDDSVPGSEFDLLGSIVAESDADVVVQDVDPPPLLAGSLDDAAELRLDGGVRSQRECRPAFAFDHPDGLLRRRAIAIDRDDPRTFTREQERHRAAVAEGVAGGLPGADHERHLARKAPTHDSGNPGNRSSSCTPSVFSTIETRLYCPTVKTRSNSRSVS